MAPDPNAPMNISPEESEAALETMTPEEKEKLQAGIEGLSEKERAELINLQRAAEAEKSEELNAGSSEPSGGASNAPPEASIPTPNEPNSTPPSSDFTSESEGSSGEAEPSLLDPKIDPELSEASAAIEEFRETGEVPKGVRNVSVTCFKCGRKTDTSVTRKQFEKQSETEVPPRFQTKCKFCNYVSTYVLTEDGTKTLS